MAALRYRRSLETTKQIDEFAYNILEIHDDASRRDAVLRIQNAEVTLEKLESRPSSIYEDYRSVEYITERKREELRKNILSELICLTRLNNDDEISLGNGGSRPEETKAEAKAYIVSGSPASGKSGVAARLAEEHGAFILDSDYAKRKFPEYSSFDGGASLVHEESDNIVFGPEDSLFEFCVYSRFNVVIPLVGKTYKSVERICNRLIELGYKINVINVALDRKKCVQRAYNRFCETGRYVPLSYIFDEVGNEPELIYFFLERNNSNNRNFESFAQISTDVEQGKPPLILEATETSPVYFWGLNGNSKKGNDDDDEKYQEFKAEKVLSVTTS